jgi:hypothetical protein
MLDPQIIVNLLPELGVGADLVRHITHFYGEGRAKFSKKRGARAIDRNRPGRFG